MKPAELTAQQTDIFDVLCRRIFESSEVLHLADRYS